MVLVVAAAYFACTLQSVEGAQRVGGGKPPSLAKPADLTGKVARTKRITHLRIKAICPDMERTNRAVHIKNVLATCP